MRSANDGCPAIDACDDCAVDLRDFFAGGIALTDVLLGSVFIADTIDEISP